MFTKIFQILEAVEILKFLYIDLYQKLIAKLATYILNSNLTF